MSNWYYALHKQMKIALDQQWVCMSLELRASVQKQNGTLNIKSIETLVKKQNRNLNIK
jgi:hypothetical protein